MLKIILKILVGCLLLLGCNRVDFTRVNIAHKMSDSLLDSIATGNAMNEFPEKYFNKYQTQVVLERLKDYYDFANRKGQFINDFYIRQNGVNRVAFIYEYHLKHDSFRFILTYNLAPEVELYEFKTESIKKDNYMITKPERRLKY
jgi:hypothetical protein